MIKKNSLIIFTLIFIIIFLKNTSAFYLGTTPSFNDKWFIPGYKTTCDEILPDSTVNVTTIFNFGLQSGYPYADYENLTYTVIFDYEEILFNNNITYGIYEGDMTINEKTTCTFMKEDAKEITNEAHAESKYNSIFITLPLKNGTNRTMLTLVVKHQEKTIQKSGDTYFFAQTFEHTSPDIVYIKLPTPYSQESSAPNQEQILRSEDEKRIIVYKSPSNIQLFYVNTDEINKKDLLLLGIGAVFGAFISLMVSDILSNKKKRKNIRKR